jgi:hypothetical protein
VKRKALPEEAYDDEFSDVDVDSLPTVDCDCVDREAALARSLTHFNSEAALAFETQTAMASKAAEQ